MSVLLLMIAGLSSQVHQMLTPKPVSCLDISQRNVLAASFNCHVQVSVWLCCCDDDVQMWQQPFRTAPGTPYMTHSLHGSLIEDLRFAPFEDVLGIGHSDGFSSIVVPGLCLFLCVVVSLCLVCAWHVEVWCAWHWIF